MAYSPEDHSVVVRGNLPGGEVWANTWAYDAATLTGDHQDVADAFHQLYEDLAAVMTDPWTASQVSVRNLSSGDEVPVSWANIIAGLTNDAIPPECALRISLRAAGSVRGGPFISGWSIQVLDPAGNIDDPNRDIVVAAFTTFFATLAALDVFLSINRPTLEVLAHVVDARVGQVFDVIRRRRNSLNEDYVLIEA